MTNSTIATTTSITTEDITMKAQTTESIVDTIFRGIYINEALKFEGISEQGLINSMASRLFRDGGMLGVDALRTAVGFMGAKDYMADSDFSMYLAECLGEATVDMEAGPLDVDAAMAALLEQDYITEDGQVGMKFIEACLKRKEAYAPVPMSQPIERRFDYVENKDGPISPLFVESIHALEDTPYTVDPYMLEVAHKVNELAEMVGESQEKEAYVLVGCDKMNPEIAYHSEFKGDKRGREYQASCHGPNGQASDRSRALMDLHGVPTDYDIEEVKAVIMAEMEDMCDDVKVAGLARKAIRAQVEGDSVLADAAFITDCLNGEIAVSKPWSFVKAARIMRELMVGNRPYIGMATGYDAKCSGPQIGALMAGDADIAVAYGFSEDRVADAYALCIKSLELAGFEGLERVDIKKPYMGIFYGESRGAYSYTQGEISDAIWAAIHGEGLNVDRAEEFHAIVSESFGKKMRTLRSRVLKFKGTMTGKVRHMMPDGFEVAMEYMEKENLIGERLGFDADGELVTGFDVQASNADNDFRFMNFSMRTNDIAVNEYVRTAFVNMVQATDALLARLIVVHLKRLGAKHIIAVHDCFRVNVTEMGLLRQAIKLAYAEVFGGDTNKVSVDLPLGKDILGLFFKGLEASSETTAAFRVSQFFDNGTRRFKKIDGKSLDSLIEQLGTTYFFDK